MTAVHKNTAQEAQEVDGGMRQKAGDNPQLKGEVTGPAMDM